MGIVIALDVPPNKKGRPVLSVAWAMAPVVAACLALPEMSAQAPLCTGLLAEYCRKSPAAGIGVTEQAAAPSKEDRDAAQAVQLVEPTELE